MCRQIYILLPVPFENSGTLPFVPWSHPLSPNLVPDILTHSYISSMGDPHKDTGTDTPRICILKCTSITYS